MQLIFIRHAEKDGHGNHLSRQGELRAEFLPEYLEFPLDDFRAPQIACVMRRKEGKSQRCCETMRPTIRTGQLTFHMIPRHRSAKLAQSFVDDRFRDISVVVCWEHSRIVDMVNIIGGDSVKSWGYEPESPDDDRDCFDATWVCDMGPRAFRLRVFRQFDIVDEQPHYWQPRNQVLFEKSYSYDRTSSCSIQ